MEKITLLYGLSDWKNFKGETLLKWIGECGHLAATGQFIIGFFNFNEFVRGTDLQVVIPELPDEVAFFATSDITDEADEVKVLNNNSLNWNDEKSLDEHIDHIRECFNSPEWSYDYDEALNCEDQNKDKGKASSRVKTKNWIDELQLPKTLAEEQEQELQEKIWKNVPAEVSRVQKLPYARDNPTILRCPYMDEKLYKKLEHDLLHFGYRLIIRGSTPYWYNWWLREAKTESANAPSKIRTPQDFAIESAALYGMPDPPFKNKEISICLYLNTEAHYSLQPSIFIVRDEDGFAGSGYDDEELFVFGNNTEQKASRAVQRFLKLRDYHPRGEIFFEKYLPYATYNDKPIAWRVFYFDGVAFYRTPLAYDIKNVRYMPQPSNEMVHIFAEWTSSVFAAADFILTEGGAWKCSRFMDGQFSENGYLGSLPLGANNRTFARAFAKAVAETPHLPEWTWCLTARVRDKNKIGEKHRVVHGTRHFAPGTKLWLYPPNWDERVTVIGVPRYSDKLTQLVMDVRKLEDFAIEKVTNKEVLTAFSWHCGTWPWSRFRGFRSGRRTWDNSDESRERILDDISWLSSLDPNGSRWS